MKNLKERIRNRSYSVTMVEGAMRIVSIFYYFNLPREFINDCTFSLLTEEEISETGEGKVLGSLRS